MFKAAIVTITIIFLLSLDDASAGCGRWVVRDNTDYLSDPAFDLSTDQATSSLASANEKKEQRIGSTKTSPSENRTTNASSEIGLSSKWLIRLNSSINKTVNLILIRSGTRLQGYGSIYDNSTNSQLTATGSIYNNTLTLDLKAMIDEDQVDSNKQFKIKLQRSILNEVFAGRYSSYEQNMLMEEGNATAAQYSS